MTANEDHPDDLHSLMKSLVPATSTSPIVLP